MIIKSIRQTSPERVTVCLEDNFEINTTVGVLTELRLFQGKNLNDKDLEELKNLSIKALALEKAINLLSYRSMSSKEMVEKLINKGINEEIAKYVANKLVSMRLIDDKSYAESLAYNYVNRGYGVGKIKSEFYKRGISKEFWEEILCSLPETNDKLDRYLSTHKFDPDNPKDINKISNSLLRRGFSWQDIKKALLKYTDNLIDEDF